MLISLALALAAEPAAEAPPPAPAPPIYRHGPAAPPPPPPPPRGGKRPTPARQIGGAFGIEDYPAAAAEAGLEGTTTIRFAVHKDGKVGDCAVAISSGHSELDAAACRLAQERFRFRPATNHKGKPVADMATRRIVWELGVPPAPPGVVVRAERIGEPELVQSDYPEEAKRLRVGGDVRVLLTLGADGRARKCEVRNSSGQPSLDGATCAIALERIRYRPARDAAGRPVEDVDFYEIEWRFIRSPAAVPPSTSPPADNR